MFLQIKNLGKTFHHYGKAIEVIKGIDLEVDHGDLISIVGESGVGKSTLLHILGTLDRPSSGTMRFDGQDVFRLTDKELARFRNKTIGFVFQFHYLLPEFTALENAMMPALISKIFRKEAEERAADLLAEVGLSERLYHKPAELSGGEQQRVALARALVMNPYLVLADEPTGNLDQRNSEEVHELFLRLNQRHSITVIVVTHNFRLAQRMPKRYCMRDGRLDVAAGVEQTEMDS